MAASPRMLFDPATGLATLPRTVVSEEPDPAPPTTPGRPTLATLMADIEQMPSHPSVPLRILWLADDPRSSAADLAKAVELDPALTARLLRISNSAYYSLRTPVTNVARAVTVLGFAAVRSLAAVATAGLDDGSTLPPEFWGHAAATANATQLVAPRYQVQSGDGFAVGLLHDLGTALLCRADPEGWQELRDAGGDLDAERDTFGIAHPDVAARIFGVWRFPAEFTDAVARHHHPLTPREEPFTRCLMVGQLIASIAVDELDEESLAAAHEELASEGFEPQHVERIATRVAQESEALASVLES